jgi:hypothetical protein
MITVFGWFEDSYTGMERESAHTLLAGYLKGGEQANVPIIFDVISKLGTASKYSFLEELTILTCIPRYEFYQQWVCHNRTALCIILLRFNHF